MIPSQPPARRILPDKLGGSSEIQRCDRLRQVKLKFWIAPRNRTAPIDRGQKTGTGRCLHSNHSLADPLSATTPLLLSDGHPVYSQPHCR